MNLALVGSISIIALGALYILNLKATFRVHWFNELSGRASAEYSARVDAGLSALGRAQRTSVVDSVVPFPVWYETSDGLNELSSLLPFWSTTVRAIGEGSRLTALDPRAHSIGPLSSMAEQVLWTCTSG